MRVLCADPWELAVRQREAATRPGLGEPAFLRCVVGHPGLGRCPTPVTLAKVRSGQERAQVGATAGRCYLGCRVSCPCRVGVTCPSRVVRPRYWGSWRSRLAPIAQPFPWMVTSSLTTLSMTFSIRFFLSLGTFRLKFLNAPELLNASLTSVAFAGSH